VGRALVAGIVAEIVAGIVAAAIVAGTAGMAINRRCGAGAA
tara:strand:- start:11736 stop:11858 length:123 start_codon:yes stop_codon:yes gene_type:complete